MPGKFLVLASFISIYLFMPLVNAACESIISLEEKHQAVDKVTLGGIGVVTLWGVYNWNYFNQSPHAQREGWFGSDTEIGGADKLGHVYSTYLTAQGISMLYEKWCFSREQAATYGAITSLVILSYMELGDSFSDYGFSYEDFIANTLGSPASYYLYQRPALSRKLDLRWGYGFNPQKSDFLTDYENSRYLLALKLGGFDSMRNSGLKHIEIHLGYYSRGFSDSTESNKRNAYFGIGLNLTDLFQRNGYTRTATFFKYYQPPKIYLEKNHELKNN